MPLRFCSQRWKHGACIRRFCTQAEGQLPRIWPCTARFCTNVFAFGKRWRSPRRRRAGCYSRSRSGRNTLHAEWSDSFDKNKSEPIANPRGPGLVTFQNRFQRSPGQQFRARCGRALMGHSEVTGFAFYSVPRSVPIVYRVQLSKWRAVE